MTRDILTSSKCETRLVALCNEEFTKAMALHQLSLFMLRIDLINACILLYLFKKKGDGSYGQKSWSFEVVVDTELVSIRGDFSLS